MIKVIIKTKKCPKESCSVQTLRDEGYNMYCQCCGAELVSVIDDNECEVIFFAEPNDIDELNVHSSVRRTFTPLADIAEFKAKYEKV
jgi:hypothetical protein